MGVRPSAVNFTPLIEELRDRPHQIAAALDGAGLVLCCGSRALLGAWVSLARSTPELRLLAAVTTAAEALQQVERLQPGLLLCTDKLEAGDGISLVETVKRSHPDTRTLLLLGETGLPQPIRRAIAAACDGLCLESRVGQGTLVAAVQCIMAGGMYLDRSLGSLLDSRAVGVGAAGPGQALSPRELDVLAHLQRGLSNAQIARALFVSPDTVKTHVRNVLQKLGAQGRGHAAVIALQRGLIDWRET